MSDSSTQVTFSPIVPWPLLVVFALGVLGVTLWAYRDRVRESAGARRWIPFALRLIAVLLCLLAAIRPTVILLEKVKQTAVIAFLVDDSASMKLNDEVGDRTRIEAARKALDDGRAAVKKLDPNLESRLYKFGDNLTDLKPDAIAAAEPNAPATAIGTALADTLKKEQGKRLVAVVLLSDGGSNAGVPPLAAAQRYRPLQVPIVTVGFGSETAGANSRDVAVRNLDCPPTVFVKNELQVRGTLATRGFPGQPLDVELYEEGNIRPIATTTVKPAEGAQAVSFSMNWIPQVARETRLTVKVKPKDGELLKANNELSTYVDVRRGGLNVLYVQGPNFTWEYRYLTRALDPAGEIRVDLTVLREPARGGSGQLPDAVLMPGPSAYDVYVLGDVPAEFLTDLQQKLLVKAVQNGAGLLMLGGRSSFGAGGWARSPLAEVLPTEMHPGDGQLEPPAGVKMEVGVSGLESYVLKVGSTRAETQQVWEQLPPLNGINLLGRAKPAAVVWAATAQGEPIMVGQEAGKGRVLAFGGETWPWFRSSDLSRQAHRKFWRQAILWAAHKEDAGEGQVKVTLDRRRAAVGQKVEITATARDGKNEPVPGVAFEMTVERIDPKGGKPETVTPYNQPTESRGTYFITGDPGEYRVSAKATKGGQEVGSDSSRFIAYRDDRELENPAADLALLKQLSETTGGQFLPPEQLAKYLGSLDPSAVTEAQQQKEHRVWDNWPFFLAFVAVLAAEWVLRKRMGWV